ncbi:MAG: 2Fe-2S iron-sulfur cluster binding domain-containing protein [Gammaproteobacteria bacterium]|jgi:2Fe-2S ferredoxin|nr:2Fe-2S iron-sulfur cluster binding domain-containing protein [Gammaproteobacteria bacterium]
MALLRVIDRDGQEHQVEGKTGYKVMETLRDLEYGVAAICGGMCSCATCHVYVDAGWLERLPEPMSDERELLMELSHYQDNSRLSCQIEFTPALDGLRVTIAPDE